MSFRTISRDVPTEILVSTQRIYREIILKFIVIIYQKHYLLNHTDTQLYGDY